MRHFRTKAQEPHSVLFPPALKFCFSIYFTIHWIAAGRPAVSGGPVIDSERLAGQVHNNAASCRNSPHLEATFHTSTTSPAQCRRKAGNSASRGRRETEAEVPGGQLMLHTVLQPASQGRCVTVEETTVCLYFKSIGASAWSLRGSIQLIDQFEIGWSHLHKRVESDVIDLRVTLMLRCVAT